MSKKVFLGVGRQSTHTILHNSQSNKQPCLVHRRLFPKMQCSMKSMSENHCAVWAEAAVKKPQRVSPHFSDSDLIEKSDTERMKSVTYLLAKGINSMQNNHTLLQGPRPFAACGHFGSSDKGGGPPHKMAPVAKMATFFSTHTHTHIGNPNAGSKKSNFKTAIEKNKTSTMAAVYAETILL